MNPGYSGQILITLLCLMAVPSSGFSQGSELDLTELSLEDLMNITVTSVSRKEQRAADVAAAIFLLTREEIHRSGMRTIPDLLRLVPGVDIAQVNSNKWAVSIRGFNSLNANKVLVLIDGRSLYNQFFGGVFWDVEDLVLDDIERIEVIRGPSAAMWGANGLNGVINIITKAAADTQGLRLHRGPDARAVVQSRPVRSGTDREHTLRCTGRPPPWPLYAHARRRRVVAGAVVHGRRAPAGDGRELRPGGVRARHAIPYGDRRAPQPDRRRRLPAKPREHGGTFRLFAGPG